jgi:hypothetical protein
VLCAPTRSKLKELLKFASGWLEIMKCNLVSINVQV